MTITMDLPEDTLAALYAQEDDLDTALSEAFAQLDAGQDRPFEEFAGEFSARFAARHDLPKPPGLSGSASET